MNANLRFDVDNTKSFWNDEAREGKRHLRLARLEFHLNEEFIRNELVSRIKA